MKKYTHAWLAFMAIKRLEKAQIVYSTASKPEKDIEYQDAAKSLVKWFKNYRDFVVKGAWYPDEVFKDNSTSHIIKYVVDTKTTMDSKKRRKLHKSSELMKLGSLSPVYEYGYQITSGNCADRCEALSHSIVDSLKMQYLEEKGSPIAPTNNHLANRFFILSHYIADCHMPLHCDKRPFSQNGNIHGIIEKNWEDHIHQSYKIDEANNRFFYNPDGYPLNTEETSPLIKSIEKAIEERKFYYYWPTNCDNAWDYMSSVSQYSYYLAFLMFPQKYNMETTADAFKASDIYKDLESKYSFAILFDAIDAIARIWLHAWHRYTNWVKNPDESAVDE